MVPFRINEHESNATFVFISNVPFISVTCVFGYHYLVFGTNGFATKQYVNNSISTQDTPLPTQAPFSWIGATLFLTCHVLDRVVKERNSK